MHTQSMIGISMALHFGVLVSQAFGGGLNPGSGGGTTATGCDYQAAGQVFDECFLAPAVCENGPFTSKEVCHASVQHDGCRGISAPRLVLVTPGSGDFLSVRSCASLGQYNVLHCRCSGNLFGWCLGPCVPTAGLAEIRPCPGAIAVLTRCPEQ